MIFLALLLFILNVFQFVMFLKSLRRNKLQSEYYEILYEHKEWLRFKCINLFSETHLEGENKKLYDCFMSDIETHRKNMLNKVGKVGQ